MKFTTKDRKELHALIQDKWGKLFGQFEGREIPDKVTEYLDYLQRLHAKIDTIDLNDN